MPRQNNDRDCGVFACMAADCIAAGDRLSFAQADMRYFRQRMLARILAGSLRGEGGRHLGLVIAGAETQKARR